MKKCLIDNKKKRDARQRLFRIHNVVGSACCYCSRPFIKPIYRTVEHIIPQSKGGTDEINNLIHACNECNEWRLNYNYDKFYVMVESKLFNNKTIKFKTYSRIDLQNILENLSKYFNK